MPTVVVLPDVLGDFEATVEAANKAFPLLLQCGHTPNYMAVVQASRGDIWEYIKAYQWASSQRWVALPRLLGGDRVKLIAGLQEAGLWRQHVNHHALGWIGSLTELRELHRLGVKGIDTGGPTWRGLNGYNLSDKWPDIPLDFAANTRELNHTQAESNLQEVLLSCRG